MTSEQPPPAGPGVGLAAEAESFAAGFYGRVPGSDAERRAARQLESRVRGLGRQVELEPIDTWPNWPLAYLLHAALAIAGSVVSVSAPIVGASLVFLAALLTFLDASTILPTTRRLLGRRASQNVVSWGDRAAPAALLIVAHYDAGRGGLVQSEPWERRRAALRSVTRRSIGPLEPFFWAVVAVLACCLLRVPGLSGTALTAIQFVPTAALIVAAAFLVDIALSGPDPGENDNASGVVLASALARRRLDHMGVHLILPGAHKAMADGMRAFLRRHRDELDPARTLVVNLDALGAGALRWTTREGPILTLRSNPELTALCEAVAEDDEAAHARPMINRVPSDGYAARAVGLPAITITCRSDPGYSPSRLDSRALGRAEAFCAELFNRLDAELGAELSQRSG